MNLKRWIPFLVAFLLPILVVYGWWGGFNPVRIEQDVVRGPYTYAYLEKTGDYSKLPDTQGKARTALEGQGITPGQAITVLYSDPALVDVNERRARTGFLIPAGSRVQPPLAQDAIAARPVLIVRVRAAVLLAPSRAYQALDDYLQKRGEGIRMPTVEIYEASGSTLKMGELSVEMAQ